MHRASAKVKYLSSDPQRAVSEGRNSRFCCLYVLKKPVSFAVGSFSVNRIISSVDVALSCSFLEKVSVLHQADVERKFLLEDELTSS